MNEGAREISVRLAAPPDLGFVSRDGYLPCETVARKIAQSEVIVSEADGEPAGYLRLEYLWSLVPYVALIWVTPERRGQGIGRALLAFTEAFLREGGHDALYSSSQADEPVPQGWHRAVGFEECGFIAGMNEGGVGEIFFRKRLP